MRAGVKGLGGCWVCWVELRVGALVVEVIVAVGLRFVRR